MTISSGILLSSIPTIQTDTNKEDGLFFSKAWKLLIHCQQEISNFELYSSFQVWRSYLLHFPPCLFVTSLPNSFTLTHPPLTLYLLHLFFLYISLSTTDCLLSSTFLPTHPRAVTYYPDNLFVTSYIVQCIPLTALACFVVPLPLAHYSDHFFCPMPMDFLHTSYSPWINLRVKSPVVMPIYSRQI